MFGSVARLGIRSRASHWPLGVLLVLLSLTFCLLAQDVVAQEAVAQSPIVLRDLSLVRGKTISEFDAYTIKLSDGSVLGWDQVLTADAGPRQEAFDQNIKTVGLPLYRLRRRIELGDWSQVRRAAEPFYLRMKERPKEAVSMPVDMSYLAALGMMRGRIADGQFAASVEPFLRARELQPDVSDPLKQALSGRMLVDSDLEMGLTDDLIPLWFDSGSVEQELKGVGEFLVGKSSRMTDGARIYLASLAVIHCRLPEIVGLLSEEDKRQRESEKDSRAARAGQLLDELSSLPEPLQPWRILLKLQLRLIVGGDVGANQLADMDREMVDLSEAQRASWNLFRGKVLAKRADANSQSEAMLELLSVPANWESQFPRLASAALYEAVRIAQERGNQEEVRIIQKELLDRYPNTYHGRLAKQQAITGFPFSN